jgi:hypothetical protein
VLKVLLTHPDGSEAAAEVAGPGLLTTLLAVVGAAIVQPASSKPAALLLATRALHNAFRFEPTRRIVAAAPVSGSTARGALDAVLDATSDLLSYDYAPVKNAAAVLLCNIAHYFMQQHKAAGARAEAAIAPSGDGSSYTSGASPGSAAAAAGPVIELVDQTLAAVLSGLSGLKDEDTAFKLLTVVGTCVLINPRFVTTAKDIELPEAIAAVPTTFPASDRIRDCATELRGLLT